QSFCDINGDGKEDFIFRNWEPNIPGASLDKNYYHILTSTVTGLTDYTQARKIVPGKQGTNGLEHAYPFEHYYNTYPLLGDFDGDGKTEILVLKESSLYSNCSPYPCWSTQYMIGEKYLEPYQNDYLIATPLYNVGFDAANLNDPVPTNVKLYV